MIVIPASLRSDFIHMAGMTIHIALESTIHIVGIRTLFLLTSTCYPYRPNTNQSAARSWSDAGRLRQPRGQRTLSNTLLGRTRQATLLRGFPSGKTISSTRGVRRELRVRKRIPAVDFRPNCWLAVPRLALPLLRGPDPRESPDLSCSFLGNKPHAPHGTLRRRPIPVSALACTGRTA